MSSITLPLGQMFFFTLFMSEMVGLCISKSFTCTLYYFGSFIIYAISFQPRFLRMKVQCNFIPKISSNSKRLHLKLECPCKIYLRQKFLTFSSLRRLLQCGQLCMRRRFVHQGFSKRTPQTALFLSSYYKFQHQIEITKFISELIDITQQMRGYEVSTQFSLIDRT